MRRLTATIAVLLLAGTLAAAPKAAPLEVVGDTALVVRSLPVTVKAPPDADLYQWSYPDGVKAEAIDNELKITAAPKGVHKIAVLAITIDIKDGKKVRTKTRYETEVVIGDVPQPGPGPGPQPDPKPPEPQPDAPIAAPGFRVLLVYEDMEKQAYPSGVQSVLFGNKVREYLKSKCVKDKDNPDGAFRVWDKDVNTDATSKPWKDAMKRPRKSVPWAIVSNGKTGWEGPVPDSADEFLKTLAKYSEVTRK